LIEVPIDVKNTIKPKVMLKEKCAAAENKNIPNRFETPIKIPNAVIRCAIFVFSRFLFPAENIPDILSYKKNENICNDENKNADLAFFTLQKAPNENKKQEIKNDTKSITDKLFIDKSEPKNSILNIFFTVN
jgi:hypothetical protein